LSGSALHVPLAGDNSPQILQLEKHHGYLERDQQAEI